MAATLPTRLRACASLWLLLVALAGICGHAARAATNEVDPTLAFAEANRLYEQGKFPEAAIVYSQLELTGYTSPAVLFNEGNAWFKAGRYGRAIAAYRKAEALAPRDPNLKFNLQFVRQKVTGSDAPPIRFWDRLFASLTLNEWTMLAAAAAWIFGILLIASELKPSWKRPLRLWTAGSGLLTLALCLCLARVIWADTSRHEGVIASSEETIVRYGPLDESQVFYKLRDGSEVEVLDQAPGAGAWIQIRDSNRRIGWVKRDQIIVL